MPGLTRLQIAREKIAFAREYTLKLIDDIDDADWFRMPSEGVTHVAWQVGHLAMAEYRLALERLRGERPEDAEMISEEFLAAFGKGSTPTSDASAYPSPTEIRETAARVHDAVLREMEVADDDQLDSPSLRPHPLFTKKIEALFWCADHELTHAGQIGLLRRLLGKEAKW